MMIPCTKEKAFVEILIFDDDGHEGYFKQEYFESSWKAANFFIHNFDENYHCTIIQINNKKE